VAAERDALTVRLSGDSIGSHKRPLPSKRLHGGGQHFAPILRFLFCVPAVFGNDGMVTMDRMYSGHPEIQILVLRSLQPGLKSTDATHGVTAKHGDAWWTDEIEPQQGGVMRRCGGAVVNMPGVRHAEPSIVAAYQCRLWMSLKCSDTGFQMVRKQPIVPIHEHEVVPACSCNAAVACDANAAMLLPYIANTRIPRDDLGAPVGRRIVDGNDFKSRIGLRQYAFHRLRQKLSLVVTGNDDADFLHAVYPWL